MYKNVLFCSYPIVITALFTFFDEIMSSIGLSKRLEFILVTDLFQGLEYQSQKKEHSFLPLSTVLPKDIQLINKIKYGGWNLNLFTLFVKNFKS